MGFDGPTVIIQAVRTDNYASTKVEFPTWIWDTAKLSLWAAAVAYLGLLFLKAVHLV